MAQPSIPAPHPAQSARVFVAIELLFSLPSALLMAGAIIAWVAGRLTDTQVIVCMLLALAGILMHLLLMMYRIITYVIGFMQMAELLDATRILLTRLFSPANAAPNPQQQ